MSDDSPRLKRAQRKARNAHGLDMNLVALIDIFTILLFFLLSSATEMQTLVIPRAVNLPPSLADATPRPTVVVLVNAQEIVVDGRTVARVAELDEAAAGAIDELRGELQRVRAAAAAGSPAASPAVTIMGDQDIPYRLLRRVMASCAEAAYAEVAFAVRTRVAAS